MNEHGTTKRSEWMHCRVSGCGAIAGGVGVCPEHLSAHLHAKHLVTDAAQVNGPHARTWRAWFGGMRAIYDPDRLQVLDAATVAQAWQRTVQDRVPVDAVVLDESGPLPVSREVEA